MIILFSILLYPVFFIILYAVGEYIFPTRNGAMIFSACASFLVSYLYYTIRSKVSQHAQRKLKAKENKKLHITRLMLLESNKFNKIFLEKNVLADNSYEGITEEKLLDFLRRKMVKRLEIYSLNGLTDGCIDLLNLLKIEYALHTRDEIIERTKSMELPDIDITKTSKLKKYKTALTSKPFLKFTVKYGVILMLLSIITPYKLYYILFGAILILYSMVMRILLKINRQNQIPYLQS